MPFQYLTDREVAYMFRATRDGRLHIDYGYIQKSTNNKAQCLTANLCRGVSYNVLFEKLGELPDAE